MTVAEFPDRTILVDGKTYLYFGGTSYLGMATHPKVQKMLFESIKRWGTAYGSSRNANVKLSIYEHAENLLAKIIGTEAALTVSSGTLAGKLVVDYLAQHQNCFYHYPKTHPAILHNLSQPLFVDGELHPELLNDIQESIVITADAILSLAVKTTKFDFVDRISPSKRIILLVDESHSLGIVGSDGQGMFASINHPKISQKIMISSLTKAYGCSGGVIGGNQDLIESIKKDSVFISASGMNPIFLQTFVDSQAVLADQRQKLIDNLDFLFTEMDFPDYYNYDVGYPVIYCHSNRIFDFLKSKNIIITNFKYPNYDTVMNRIVINANHTPQDLEQLQAALVLFHGEVRS